MRYCQRCGEARAQPLGHEGDHAVCPACGHREPSPRRSLFVVTGASAVGKSTVTAALAEELAGEAAVFDSDTLMDPFERAGGGTIDWDALAEAWVEVAHGLARQGRPTVLLCSFDPDLVERLPNRAALTAVHYLLLDCDDAEREARLAARPPWRGPDAAAQRGWSRLLRAAVATRIRTDLRSPAETVDAIAAWVRAGGTHRGDPPVDAPQPPAGAAPSSGTKRSAAKKAPAKKKAAARKRPAATESAAAPMRRAAPRPVPG